jgi:hypothetical protein
LKKLISLSRFGHLYNKGACLEKFSHIEAVAVANRSDLYVLEGITDEDIVAMKIMGARVEEEYAFEASQVNPNGVTKLVMKVPGESQYRIFEISTGHYSDGEKDADI